MRRLAPLLLLLLVAAGCTGALETATSAVDDDGTLSLVVPVPAFSEQVLNESGGVTVSEIVLHRDIDIPCLLAAPETPEAAIVYAPGAGVLPAAHLERAIRYAEAGIAFCVVDIRGNGGGAAGHPFDLNSEFAAFAGGNQPQTHRIAADLIACREVLAERYPVPVWAMGSSNGGRYAELAAAADTDFAGYIGVSTSGFGRAGDDYGGDARRFLLSIDPSVSIASISPRPVLLFHATEDPVIPYADGQALFEAAAEPREFVPFNGTHGVNAEVDAGVMAVCV
ncbi:alpha/beta hydrolase [Methanofollis fontis]|uniref:Alpha/beta hydrolase n=1 Tax=Methanofollis fontis TaxID=2052832 RepID=A0A483CVK5_9EURY|nr:alpha/beta hydrolase [Methanofollis fontis]TAJ45696.1 alpha/beta hydrolase [Methanofollis fontis]